MSEPLISGGFEKSSDPSTAIGLELIEERLRIDRAVVEGQTVRVAVTTQMREQQVEVPLLRETYEIEHIAIGRVVETTPEVRHDGDVTIVPIMEETLVLERRLVLKEEVRIRRVRSAELHQETVQLREQTAVITRTDGTPAPGEAGRPQGQPQTK